MLRCVKFSRPFRDSLRNIAVNKSRSIASLIGIALALWAPQRLYAADMARRHGDAPKIAAPKIAATKSAALMRGDCGPYGHKGPWGGCIPGGPFGAGNYYELGPHYFGPKPYYGPPAYAPASYEVEPPDYGPRYWGSRPYGIPAFQ
jgi:hypothetical protein